MEKMERDYQKEVELNASDFVLVSDYVPAVIQEIRYHSTYNFVGDRVDGYEQGYRIKVFDAYRPATAVRHFTLWGVDDLDLRMKPFFYPDLEKQELFRKGYIASKSSHSRGSTIDLTLLDMKTGKEVDMGSPFDYFSEVSHPDYKGVAKEQYENRMFLQDIMVRGGFEPYDCEWWHFTLKDEPFPDTYFDFPVSTEVLKR